MWCVVVQISRFAHGAPRVLLFPDTVHGISTRSGIIIRPPSSRPRHNGHEKFVHGITIPGVYAATTIQRCGRLYDAVTYAPAADLMQIRGVHAMVQVTVVTLPLPLLLLLPQRPRAYGAS